VRQSSKVEVTQSQRWPNAVKEFPVLRGRW